MKKRYVIGAFIVLVATAAGTILYLDYRKYMSPKNRMQVFSEELKIAPDPSGDKYQSFVNSITGCKKSQSITKENFSKNGFNCQFTQIEDRLLVAFPFDPNFQNSSIVADIPKKKFTRVVFLLPGGPLINVQGTIDINETSIHRSFFDENTAVFVPQYTGTQGDSVYPNSDIEFAAQQVTQYIKRQKMKNVSIVGHSAGGYVAALVQKQTGLPTTIFATSLLKMNSTYKIRKLDDRENIIFGRTNLKGEYIRGDKPYEEISLEKFLPKYFGRFYSQDLIDDVLADPDIRLIYGDRDFAYTISKANLPNFEALRDRICLVPGMGHQPETLAQVDAVRRCWASGQSRP